MATRAMSNLLNLMVPSLLSAWRTHPEGSDE